MTEDRQSAKSQGAKSQRKGAAGNSLSNSHTLSEEKIPLIKRETIVPYLAGALLLFVGALVFIVYRSYAWPAFMAVMLYVGFHSGYGYLYRAMDRSYVRKFAPDLSALIATVLIIILILLPIAIVIQQLLLELYRLVADLRALFSNDQFLITLQRFPLLIDIVSARPFFWVAIYNTLAEIILEYGSYLNRASIGNWVANLFTIISGSLGFTFSLGLNLLLAIVMLYFLFRDGPSFYRSLKRALPFSSAITDAFVARATELTLTVLRGTLFVSILQGTLLSLGLFICGFQSYVVYGVVGALFSLVPLIGTAVVWLPAALYLTLIEGSYGLGLFLSIYGLSAYLLLENILKPKLLNEKLGLHPLFIFFAILGGLVEFGPTGVILGPLFVTLLATIWNFSHIWGQGDPKSSAQSKRSQALPATELKG